MVVIFHAARTAAVALTTILLAAALAPGSVAQTPTHTASSVEVTSFDGTEITINVCQPTGTGITNRVPVVLHSHGWGGSKSGCGSFEAYYAAGMGVVSISQRGFGGSGGQANVHDPDFEGLDNIAVIDHIATLDWVALDAPGDPVMGAIGGSYGGGFQYLIAFLETATFGDTRLDAIVPEITWHNLIRALAPNEIVRSEWVGALYATGAASLPTYVHEAAVFTFATGLYPGADSPTDLSEEFFQHGPAYWVDQGIQIDVPTLIGQGTTDTLFVMNEGRDNFERTMTPAARAESYFIGYNGGHVLPTVYPQGVGAGGDPCSAELGTNFAGLALDFLENQLLGANNPMPSSPYSVATSDASTCIHIDSLDPTETIRPDPVDYAKSPLDGTGAMVNGAVTYWPILEDLDADLTLAGIPQIHGRFTGTPLARTFFGLAVGNSPADARVIDSQWMPYGTVAGAVDEPFESELGGIATIVPEGQNLYLVMAPVVDQFVAHGSRAPSAAAITQAYVHLPVVGDLPGSTTTLDLSGVQAEVGDLHSLPHRTLGGLPLF